MDTVDLAPERVFSKLEETAAPKLSTVGNPHASEIIFRVSDMGSEWAVCNTDKNGSREPSSENITLAFRRIY